MNKWQLQDAKNRLSEVVRKATDEGPQLIALLDTYVSELVRPRPMASAGE